MNFVSRTGVAALIAIGAVATVRAEESVVFEKKKLSLAAARKIVAAAGSRRKGQRPPRVVVDDAGNIIQLTRMDSVLGAVGMSRDSTQIDEGIATAGTQAIR
jgi:uncharacterized protein GlcG (DUF336 family)